jgi:hypothetical protein
LTKWLIFASPRSCRTPIPHQTAAKGIDNITCVSNSQDRVVSERHGRPVGAGRHSPKSKTQLSKPFGQRRASFQINDVRRDLNQNHPVQERILAWKFPLGNG